MRIIRASLELLVELSADIREGLYLRLKSKTHLWGMVYPQTLVFHLVFFLLMKNGAQEELPC